MCGNKVFFFFNDTATTEIYTLSLHDALPISVKAVRRAQDGHRAQRVRWARPHGRCEARRVSQDLRSEEHTSELQSRQYLVCRLLLEKKTKTLSVFSSIVVSLSATSTPMLELL